MIYSKAYMFPPLYLRWDADFNGWPFGYEMGRVARSIALGHGFGSPFHGWTGPTAWLPPVYPYFLAGIFRLFGVYSPASGFVALTCNCIAAALTAWLIYRIAERVAGRKIGLCSAWAWAVLPSMMGYAVFWAWETSFSALLLMWALWQTLRLPERRAFRPWLELGVLWGVMALVNTALLAAMPFSLAWGWWESNERRRSLYYVAVWVIMFALCTPWIIRDRVVMGKWMFLRDNFWAEFSFGNGQSATGVGQAWRHPASQPAELRRYDAMGEIPWIESRKREVLTFVEHNPAQFVRLTGVRMILFWTDPFQDVSDDLTPDVVIYTHWQTICLSALAWAGLVLLWRRNRRGAALIASAMVFYPAVYYITSAFPRYRHPVEPLMVMLAAYAVVTAREGRRFRATA